MSEHDLSAWIESIAEVFDSLELEWTIIGALAANRYRAEPRFTTDVDALVADHPRLISSLEAAGYEVEAAALPGEPPHLLRCHQGPESIDILLPVVAYQTEALQRSTDHRLTVEDVLIHKLIAWRPRDRDDVRSILSTQPSLDGDYLNRWIAAWELDERWDQAQRDQ